MTDNSPANPILAAWQKTLAQLGQNPAIYSPSGAVLRSFMEIGLEALKIGKTLKRIPPRSVVAVQIGNSELWPELLLALWRHELIPLPLGEMGPTELAYTLGICRAAALVTNEGGPLVVQRRPVSDDATVWSVPAPEFLKLTSGTTSSPRAVRFRASQLLADCENICASMGLTESDVNYGVIPLSHSYGFSNLITPLLVRGVKLVVSRDRMPRAVLDGLATTGATVFPATPIFFQKLGDLENAPKLPALRLCISAGAPLTRAAASIFQVKYGLKIHSFYGSSECGGIAYDGMDAQVDVDGFVGTAMSGVKIGYSGEAVGPIEVRSAAVGDGYFPADEPKTLGGGRFIPADLIQHTEKGLFLVGRTSDVINVAGRKLNPCDVEARLAEFPGVKQAVVFGVKSPLRGEEPIACVVGENLAREELMRFCQEKLSAWQLPRDVWLVGEIPTNERGKIQPSESCRILPGTTPARWIDVTMSALVSDAHCLEHDTGHGHPECPERFTSVMKGLEQAGLLEKLTRIEPRAVAEEDLRLAHEEEYLHRAERDILSGLPQLSTGDTAICEQSWDAAKRAAGCALAAVDAVITGKASNAFCAVRPPGHHASADRGMGFCVLNNVALAARHAQRRHGIGRVLIVDWDVHHGNGTQDIFYEDGSVFFCSTHQWPWYPGTGRTSETGAGPGKGTTLNGPLPAGSGRAEIFAIYENQLVPAMKQFRPELVLISAGFDSRVNDPLGDFQLTDTDFADLTKLIRGIADKHAHGRVVSLMEGGYNLSGLARAATAHVEALLGES